MKYLSFSADAMMPAVSDLESDDASIYDYDFPDNLVEEIEGRNDRYRDIVPPSSEERRQAPISELIKDLDKEGVGLAVKIRDFFQDKDGAKVEYYSEGLRRKLLVG